MDTPVNFFSGDAIRRARKRSKLTLRQVESTTGVSIATLSRLENGSDFIPVGVIKKLSKLYNVIFMVGEVKDE